LIERCLQAIEMTEKLPLKQMRKAMQNGWMNTHRF
jgi:hypothetical protein